MGNLEQAKKLFDKGIAIVPCEYRKKKNNDPDILTKDYSITEFSESNNIAVQLDKVGWVAFDPETNYAQQFAKKWLSQFRTLRTCREHNKVITTVGYFFKNNGMLEKNIKLDDSFMEIRAQGIHILHGETELKPKGTGIFVKRRIELDVEPIPLTEEIIDIGKKIAFSAALAKWINNKFNKDETALKIDACLSRYTKWNLEQRLKYLDDFYSVAKSDYAKDVSFNDLKRNALS